MVPVPCGRLRGGAWEAYRLCARMTARKGPYSVCCLTSSWICPLARRPCGLDEVWREEPVTASARTRPLMRTQVLEFCKAAKPGGHAGDA